MPTEIKLAVRHFMDGEQKKEIQYQDYQVVINGKVLICSFKVFGTAVDCSDPSHELYYPLK